MSHRRMITVYSIGEALIRRERRANAIERGDGYGYGYGCGDGYGYGYGCGDGYGYGDGDSYGYGSGCGDGDSYGTVQTGLLLTRQAQHESLNTVQRINRKYAPKRIQDYRN